MPAFPGAMRTSSTRVDPAIFHARACSLPPEPMTSTRMGTSSMTEMTHAGVNHRHAVFVGGGNYTYQVYSASSQFKYDVKVGDPLTTAGFTTGCAVNWHTGEVWATNFENNVDVILRHAGSAATPYTDRSRTVSTLRSVVGEIGRAHV